MSSAPKQSPDRQRQLARAMTASDDEIFNPQHAAMQAARMIAPEPHQGTARIRALEDALREAADEMDGVTIFVNSRERIKYPEGASLWREAIAKARAIANVASIPRETMSEQGLKAEIRRLTKELDALRADLRAERGEEPAGEVIVTRQGAYPTDPTTFHVRLSADIVSASKEGAPYIEAMLDRMRHEIVREL